MKSADHRRQLLEDGVGGLAGRRPFEIGLQPVQECQPVTLGLVPEVVREAGEAVYGHQALPGFAGQKM